MSFSSKEYRAIYFVARQRGWKLTLCHKPVVRYYVGDRIISVTLGSIVREYDSHSKKRRRTPDFSLSPKP